MTGRRSRLQLGRLVDQEVIAALAFGLFGMRPRPDRSSPVGLRYVASTGGRSRFGSPAVDLERNVIIDLLRDCQAETLASWLRQHPGVEVVARDRAGAYADGVRRGAPDATQVADRWHLLRNLGDAVQTLTDRHGAAARRATQHVVSGQPEAAAAMPFPLPTLQEDLPSGD